jgi:hypothetical protein
LFGIISSLMVYQYGQTRIWFAMSRDGLLPGVFSQVHPRFKTPYLSTWIAAAVVGIPAGVWEIGTFADLPNIGTLFAFVAVSAGVLILRRTQPTGRGASKFPRSPDSLDRHCRVFWFNARAAGWDLDPLYCLACSRSSHLCNLRPQPQQARAIPDEREENRDRDESANLWATEAARVPG